MKKLDLVTLKRIPILTVAERLGVDLVRTGGDTWQEKDKEKRGQVTSLTLFTHTNSFVRFSGKESGGCSKGSVIDFVRHVKNDPDFRSACDFLSTLL